MNRKTEKSILRLSHFVKKHKRDHLVKIDSDKIIVDVNERSVGGMIFFFVLMFLTPFSLLIYFLLFKYNLTEAGALLFWLAFSVYYAYKLTRGDNILIVDLTRRCLVIENINPIFKRLFKKRVVDFSRVSRTSILEQNAGFRIDWLEIRAYDKNNRKIILSNFEPAFPSRTIAIMFKETLDIVLREHTTCQ